MYSSNATLWWKQHLTTYQAAVALAILVRQVYSAVTVSRVDDSEFNWLLSMITTTFFSLVLLIYSSTYLELYVNLGHCD